MVVSLVTISIVGLAAGILFSMPVIGPVSILVVSHALKGHLRYCFGAALGASIVDLTVCFLAVNGVARLFGLYVGAIPYVLLAASAVIFFLGIKIMRTRFNIDGMSGAEPEQKPAGKIRGRNAFLKGLFLNASNPLLFFGWLTASFLVLSLVASWGLSVGGLDTMVVHSVGEVKQYAATHSSGGAIISLVKPAVAASSGGELGTRPKPYSRSFQLVFCVCYAVCVAFGTNVWFWSFSYFLVRNRLRLRIGLISRIIQTLGIFLCGFSLYILGRGIGMLLHA